jgi:hypothetical protein
MRLGKESSRTTEENMITKTRLRVLLWVGLAMVAMFLVTTRAAAQEPITRTLTLGEETGGLDIIFLIDNSDSMYAKVNIQGQTTSQIGNDEDMLRLKSVRHVIERLLLDNLHLQTGVEHRIGVVTFGGINQSTVDIALESLKTDSDEARALRQEYLGGKLSTDNRGNTHPIEAFKQINLAGAGLWRDKPPAENQVKAIILLTDGRPHISKINGVERYLGQGENKRLNPAFDKAYFEALKQAIDSQFPQAVGSGSAEGYHIWVVAMNEDWEDIRPYWEEIVGDHWQRIYTADDIPETFNEILEEIYPLAGKILEPGSFHMWPYLAKAAFSIFASGPLSESDVIFYRQDGSQLSCSETSVTCKSFGDTIRWIEVDRPLPGEWEFVKRSDLTVKVRFHPLFGRIKLAEPKGAPSQLTETKLVYKLEDIAGKEMEQQEGFRLTLEGQVIPPDSSTPLSLRFTPIGGGRYESLEEIPLFSDGDYFVQIEGHAFASPAEKVNVVPRKTYPFAVTAVSGRLASSAEPITSLTYPQIQIGIVGSDGEPVEIDVGGDIALEAKLYLLGTEPEDGLELDMQRQQGAQFVATNEIVGLAPGEFWIEAKSWLRTNDGQQIDLFLMDEKTFVVSALSARLESPADTQHPFQMVELVYQMTDRDGTPVDFDAALDVRLKLHVTLPSGQQEDLDMISGGGGRFSAALFLGAGPAKYSLKSEGWLELDGERLDLFETAEEIAVDSLALEMSKPAVGECPPEETEVALQFNLLTTSGEPFQPHKDYPVDFSGSLVEYLGDGGTQPLEPSFSAPGVLIAHFVPDQPGQWVAHIEGAVTDPQNSPLTVVSEEKEFCILDVAPVALEIVSPGSGEEIPLRVGPRAWPLFAGDIAPVNFEVQVIDLDNNGQPLAVTQVITSSASDVLGFELVGPRDKDLSDNLSFVVESPNAKQMTAESDALVEEGVYTFRVVARPDAAAEVGYVWAAAAEQGVEVSFSRRDIHRIPGVLLSIAQGMAALAMLGLAIYVVLLITAPMKGSLMFMKPSGALLATVKLPKRRWATLKGKKIPDAVRRMAGVDKLRVRNKGGNVVVSWDGGGPSEIQSGNTGKVGKLRAEYRGPSPQRTGGGRRPPGRP